MSVPEFAFPFTVQGSDAVTVEQGSVAEVEQAVGVLLLTPVGSRFVLPSYGVPDLLFAQQPLVAYNDIMAAINRWEPRAAVVLVENVNQFDEKIASLVATVSPRS